MKKFISRKKWSKEDISLLEKLVKSGMSAKQISEKGKLPYNQNSIQKQMGRLGLSKGVKIKKLPKDNLEELKSFLKDNWDKQIPEVLVSEWNKKNKVKVTKRIVIYHLTKMNIKIPYNEVFKIKYHKKNTFKKEDKMDIKQRIEKIKSHLPVKYFYEEDFDTSKRNQIAADVRIDGLNDDHIFKCGPILKKEQEYFLFRKFNYLKYKLFKLTNINLDRLRENSILEIEETISKIEEVKNILIKCNTRLIVKPVSFYFNKDSFNGDEFVSNGYMHLMKAIDCFDHRKGFKFSTYCIWVLKSNLRRDVGKLFDQRTVLYESTSDEDQFDPMDDHEEDYRLSNVDYNKSFVKEMFDKIEKINPKNKNLKTRIQVIKSLYGLDDGKPALLREVGSKLGISRERVRQLKEDTLKMLQDLNLVYDPIA